MNIRFLPVAALVLLTGFSACKKETKTDANAELATEMQTHSEDYNDVSNGVDDADSEASTAVEAYASFSGRETGDSIRLSGACGMAVSIDSASSPRSITITYNGNNCRGTHFRTGSIKISMPREKRWRIAGSTITVSFQNLKLRRLSDNKSITINGTQTLTNVSGGLLSNLPNLQSIVHTITSSDMSITFDDNTQRTWNIARKRTFTLSNGLVLKITGIGTSGTATNLAEWGTNRLGHAFSTAIREPLTFRQDCSGRLTSGKLQHEGIGSSTVTFGLNASGEPTTCPVGGSFYLKLSWSDASGTPHSVIKPY